MKFLCICNHGNCRSYALARILKYSGHEAIAIGMQFTSEDSLNHFIKWADHVVVLTEHDVYKQRIVMGTRSDDEYYEMDIGPDRWGNPFNPELHKILVNRATDMFIELRIKTQVAKNVLEAPTWK